MAFPVEHIGRIGLKLLVSVGRGETLPRFCSYESQVATECEYWL